eukprot:g19231.t1
MDKVGGRNKTDDLLAAFRKKISDRIDRGERKEVHAASDRPSPDEALDATQSRASARTRKAMLAPGPGRSRSPEVRGSLRNTEERKRQLLDGPLEPEVARTASKVDEELARRGRSDLTGRGDGNFWMVHWSLRWRNDGGPVLTERRDPDESTRWIGWWTNL